MRSTDEAQEYISACAGRYTAFLIGPTIARVYPDPNGSFGTVYNIENGTVAASVYLALSDKIRRNEEYPLGVDAGLGLGPRFSFGYTADPRVRRILSNHYLDLKDLSEHRFWPTEKMSFDSDGDPAHVSDLLQTYETRHQEVMRAISQGTTPTILPLSAGKDSRILLSLARPFISDIDQLFTHITNWSSKLDAVAATMLADKLGVNSDVFDCRNANIKIDRNTVRRESIIYTLATGKLPMARVISPPDVLSRSCPRPGGVLMRGHVTDILKAVLWDGAAHPRGSHLNYDTSYGLKMMLLMGDKSGFKKYVNDPWFVSKREAWLETLPTGAHPRILDFAAIELFRPFSLGESFHGFRHNFYLAPGNDRQIITAAASLPPVKRAQGDYVRAVLERHTPEFSDVPFLSDIAKRMTADEQNSILSKHLD